VALVAASLVCGCGTGTCTEDVAAYSSFGFCSDPGPIPTNLEDFATSTRETGGTVTVGHLAGEPEHGIPVVRPDSCSMGTCLAEARLLGRIVVSDPLGSDRHSVGDEIRVSASDDNLLFRSDEDGTPRCVVPAEWMPAASSTICYDPTHHMLPRPGDTFAFFLAPARDEGGSRDLLWAAQVAGETVSGAATFSSQDVGLDDLRVW